jgi:hypothetical protein
MNINLVDRHCRHCKISLSEFEVNEKGSLCIDCYNEENEPVKIQVEKPQRLKNKKLFIS